MNTGRVHLDNVSFRYQGQRTDLFTQLTLDIPSARVTAVLGPNGSGKTTLLHLILGLHSPDAGVVCLAERPRQHYARHEIGKLVGLVSQDEYIPFNFTVRDYVLMGRAPHLAMLQVPGQDDEVQVEAALQYIGAVDLIDRAIQSLSGGERQMVMLARALAQHPRILLLDEPTAHLDLSNKQHTADILRSLAAQGVTVIFSTHDPNLASIAADHIILMREGRVIAEGEAQAALTPSHLSETYGVAVTVLEHEGRLRVL